MHSIALLNEPDCTCMTPFAAMQLYFHELQQKQIYRTLQYWYFIERQLEVFNKKPLLTAFGHIETSFKRNLLKVFQSDKCNKYCKFPLLFFFSEIKLTLRMHICIGNMNRYMQLNFVKCFLYYHSVSPCCIHIISCKRKC